MVIFVIRIDNGKELGYTEFVFRLRHVSHIFL